MTKAGRYGASRKYFDYSPDRIRRSVLESLDRFHTDYLDVVYLHDCEFVADESPDANGPGFPVDALHAEKQQNLASDADDKAGPGDAAVVEAYKALLQLKAEGKIRQAGLAGYPLPVLLRLARLIRSTLEPVDIVQTYSHYNLQNRTLQAYVRLACRHFLIQLRLTSLLARLQRFMKLVSSKLPTPVPSIWGC